MTSPKTEWTWNVTYLKILGQPKLIIKEPACMNFYDKTQALHIKTDVSGYRLGAALLQTKSNTSCPRHYTQDSGILRPIAQMSKALSSVEKGYSNIGRETLGAKKLHHYCILRELSTITDNKTLVVIFKEDIPSLSQR